jgi:hypothetical protein
MRRLPFTQSFTLMNTFDLMAPSFDLALFSLDEASREIEWTVTYILQQLAASPVLSFLLSLENAQRKERDAG